MKKIISVFVLALLLVVVVGCGKERTYKADGTYMVWELGTSDTKVLLGNGSGNFLDVNGNPITVKTPALSTLTVTIENDKVVKWYIDELQSKAYASVPADEESHVLTKVVWKWNDRSKKELGYDYGMEKNAAQGEWFLQISNLERNWLENEPALLSSVTIHHDVYVALAQEALQNAKDGKVGAITDGDHYSFDVAFVTADVNEEGKLSNLNIDGWLFANGGKSGAAYDAATPYAWNAESKYESYGPMTHEEGATTPRWQDQIDTLEEFIAENGWKGTYTPGRLFDDEWKDKGMTDAGVEIAALSSVTVQLSADVEVINMLYNFFPKAW